jgi:hypothetical protein
MKPRTIASSPEMSITTIKTISSSVIGMVCWSRSLEHDPEKWAPVFGKDHAQTKR